MEDVRVNVDRYFDPVKPLVDYVKNNPSVAQKAGITLEMVKNASGDKIDEYLDVLIKVGA